MAPAQNLRPLRPPPQPWVPPYHRASVDGKMKFIRWAFFTFFVLLVVYPSARALGSPSGGSVLGFPLGGSSSSGSVYHIDEAVKQKGNDVEILKPGGGGLVEGLLVDGGRGLDVRNILDSHNISKGIISVHYYIWEQVPDEESVVLHKNLLKSSENLIMVLKNWFGDRNSIGITRDWVTGLVLKWSCQHNLTECFPPSTKHYFAQLDPIVLDLQKEFGKFLGKISDKHHHEIKMDITLTGGNFFPGDSMLFGFNDLYEQLYLYLYELAGVREFDGEKEFIELFKKRLQNSIQNFQEQTFALRLCDRDLEAIKGRLKSGVELETERGLHERNSIRPRQSQKEFSKARKLVHSREVDHSTKPIEPSWQSWSDFDKDIEDLVKWYQSIAPLYQDGIPELSKKEWDRQMETQVHHATNAIGQFCLRLPDCTERDVENAVQKTETKFRSLMMLVQSRDIDLLATRELSKDEWADFHKQTEAFGKAMDDLATKLAALDPSNLPQLGRETFDQQAGDLISSNAEHFREKCLKTSGCTEPDVITMVQSMKDRIQKSSDLIPSPAPPPMVRDLSSEEWTTVDERIEIFGKSTDSLAQQLAASGSPGAKKAFDQTVDEWIRVIAQGTQEQCVAVEGCNDQDLAAITQKLLDRALKSAGAIPSRDDSIVGTQTANPTRDVSKETWAELDGLIESIGKELDDLVINPGQDKVPLTKEYLESMAEQFSIDEHPECDENEEGCNQKDLETIHQKVLDRIHKSASLVHSREVPASIVNRELSEDLWTTIDQFANNLGVVTDGLAREAQSRATFDEEVTDRINDRMRDMEENCPTIEGCDEQVLAKIKQKYQDQAQESVGLIHARGLPESTRGIHEEDKENWYILAKRNYPVEFLAGMDQTMEFANKIFNALLPIIREFRLDMEYAERALKYVAELATEDSLRSCMELSYCTEQDVKMFSAKFEVKVHEFLGLMDWESVGKRESPEHHSARRNLPLNLAMAFEKRMTVIRNIFTAAISVFHEVGRLNPAGSPSLDGKNYVDVVIHLVNSIITEPVKECEEHCSVEDLKKFADRYAQEIQQFRNALGYFTAGKRSDGLLIPFLDLAGPPSLTEGSIPGDKRDIAALNHQTDATSIGMNNFQHFAEIDQTAEQDTNQTAIEVDCNIESTEEGCNPKPDPTPIPDNQTKSAHEKDDFVTNFTNWLPFIALFSIISLLLLLLGLKCCTVWSLNRRSLPEESDESQSPTKATSQPLLGPAARLDDEEAQMSQIREPVAPMGLDGASEGWARKWISSTRGNERSVSERTSADASSPHLLPKPSARGPPTRAPRIPSLQLPKAIFHTVRAAGGLGSPVETEIQKRRVKWGSTL